MAIQSRSCGSCEEPNLCFIFFILFTACQAVDTCERDVQPFPFTKLLSEDRRHLDSLWLVKLPVHLRVSQHEAISARALKILARVSHHCFSQADHQNEA